jgi:hypothetical protein
MKRPPVQQPLISANVLLWLAMNFFKISWWLVRALWRRAFNVLAVLVFTSVLAAPADAGWFIRKPDPAIEAANKALQHAAQTANESARIQADQNIRIAEAISQLSSERTQVAGHLEVLARHSAKDSAWAAALESFGPTLVVALVLAVGGVALWLVTRSGPADAQLVEVLLDEVASESPRWLAPTPSRPLLRADVDTRALVAAEEYEAEPEHDSIPNTTEEYPF